MIMQNVLNELLLPLKIAIVNVIKHQSTKDEVSLGNALANQAVRKAALPPNGKATINVL